MKSMKLLPYVAVFALAAGMYGCVDDAPVLGVPGLGNNRILKYVAVGNSLTAGYQSNGLYESAQIYSFPNLLAQQLRAVDAEIGTFEQPLYTDPGTPGADGKASRYEIISLVGPVIGPRGLSPGVPKNSTLARPYDNLGIPGSVVFDFLDTTSFAAKAAAPRSNPLFQLVLRNPALGKSVFEQARRLKPDLVTFWFGNNDVLGFATSGGVSPSGPTSAQVFAALYAQALDSLRAALPNARIVVATIPDVTSIPYFTTAGARMAAALPAGNPLRYQVHGETGVATGSTTLTESTPPLITLTGTTYAALLGRPTGQWYRDRGYPALPPGIDTTKVFGFDPRNPWPDALVLDAAEQATAATAVSAFNATIKQVAAAKNAGVVDINAFFAGIKRNGLYVQGQKFTADYVSGGLFSLDGVHPSNRGAGVLANEFIKVINQKFGMSIAPVNIALLPGIPAPVAKGGSDAPVLSPDAYEQYLWLFGGGR
jgi:lysophospholipase L1-like esterase